MDINTLRHQIDCASKKKLSPLVIKNCNVVNVFSGQIIHGDIAVDKGKIVGVGEYEGQQIIDGEGAYAVPGLIESHIHIESSFTTPEEFGKMAVPFGTTTVIADPHEITNVCGKAGLEYMIKSARNTALDIKYMIPSCVPATPFENSGAKLNAKEISEVIDYPDVLGLGEFMNYAGVLNGDKEVLKKITLALNKNKIIDGHAPGVKGYNRQAYISAGIKTDHECSTIEEMEQSVQNGMYVELRDGSACHDLENLVKGITKENSRRLLLCSDDRQPVTFYASGDLNNHLKLCVKNGINPVTAIQMATLNAAECYRLYDRGAIAPGYRADIVLMDNLQDFNAKKVFINGELVAENGKYLKEVKHSSIKNVSGTVHVKDFSRKKLTIKFKKSHKGFSKAHTIEITPGSIVTKNTLCDVSVNSANQFIYNPQIDVVKIAVIERHNYTGNTGLGLLKNYGIKNGAIAITIAHDSHNIICVGTNDEDMEFAVNELVKQHGGIVLVNKLKIIESLTLPVAGLMSNKDGMWVKDKLSEINQKAYDVLGVNKKISPVSTLCFMALPVIPELKITDKGLFDVNKFQFIEI